MSELTRRTMLKMAGSAGMALAFPGKILAILEDGTLVVQDHKVPADKGLSPEWIRQLTERGAKEVWTGAELDSIGMPVGGIATGQLYLCGDGTLGCWELFNHHDYQNEGPYSYANRPIPKLVEFGFRATIDQRDWELKKGGFKEIHFDGQYPIGQVAYADPDCPLAVGLTAYSPFIPLVAKDSALPATVFEITFSNLSNEPHSVELQGSLENACARSAEQQPLNRKRHTRVTKSRGFTCFQHSSDDATAESTRERSERRSDILIADFEGETYGNWKVEGEAFGPGPSKGTLPGQNPVSGFVGKSLVNTYYKGDGTTGKLTSPEFKIERDFINFKIGGGHNPGKECINLLVDGKVARTSTGLNDEHLMWDAWNVENLSGKQATIEIVDAATGGWGHINIDQIFQADRIESKDDYAQRHGDPNLDSGSMAFAFLGRAQTTEDREYDFGQKHFGRLWPEKVIVPPGQTRTLTFVLTWNFPHHPQGRNYANHFSDAQAVASYVASNYKRLSRDTKLWRDTYYDSTLPYWLLDRLHSTAGNMATGVTEWRKNGLFWCWEGVVCCSGTCTHVWNYEHAMARLFPELEKNIRVLTDFGVGFDKSTGLVGMRSDREYAADGQCGTILKAYREHQVSSDSKFLKANWPHIKLALEYLIKHDGNGDGIIEDAQPNTYDIEFFGANTFIGSLYLGALRAGEEMAKEMDDQAFAEQCHSIFQQGSDATMKRLWNGEFFIQEVDETKYKKYQYGPGCLADQLFGQGWAHQVGLGHIYPRENVVTALRSVWKYNWAPDVAGQNKRWPPQRPFALPGEAGLFTCTWPVGGREQDPVLYRDEVWTGIEYQVAGNMIWEGLVDEGLSICRAIHERYHPIKRNPYNEVECSDHYARAMASWGVYTALSGFHYHGPGEKIAFGPKITPEKFQAAFTTAQGWGTFAQVISPGKQENKITVAWGKLNLKEIALESSQPGNVIVRQSNQTIPAEVERKDGRVVVRLSNSLSFKAGQSIEIAISA